MPFVASPFGDFDTRTTYAGDYPIRQDTWIRRPDGLPHHTLHVGFSGGPATFRYRDRQFEAHGGDAVLIEPGCPHDYGSQSPAEWKLVFAVFIAKPEWRRLLDWPEELPGHRRLRLPPSPARETAYHKLRELVELVSLASPHRELFLSNALESALLWIDLARPGQANRPATDARLQRTVQHIHHHLKSPLNAEALCEVAGLSVTQLTRLFKQRFDQTPGQFVEAQRLERARRLLDHTAMPIAEVADTVGYADAFYFTNRFRRAIGVSPRAYRRRQRGEAAID